MKIERPSGIDVSVNNPSDAIYLKGNAITDGSLRAVPNTAEDNFLLELRTTGVWASTGIEILDDIYDGTWDGLLEVPTKNAVYDKIESLHVADIDINYIGATSYTTVEDYINTNGSNGLINGGGDVTDGGSGTVDVAAGSVMLRTTDSSIGSLVAADFPAVVGLALTDGVTNFVYVDYNAGTPQVAAAASPPSSNNNELIALVVRDGTRVHISATHTHTSQFNQIASKMHALVDGVTRQSGSVTSETGSRKLAVTSGIWWLAFDEYALSALDTSAAGTFTYYYQDGASGWTEITSSTTIDNAQYDDTTGTLAALTGQRRGVHWVYLGVDGDYYVVYGLGNYTLAQAQDALPPANLPPQITTFHAAIIAKIIVGNGQTNLESVQNPYDVQFGTSIAASHLDLTDIGTNTHAQIDTALLNIPQIAHIQLTTAQVNALNTTPIELVAAPASGLFIQLIGASAMLTHVTTAFTGGSTLELVIGTGTSNTFKSVGSFIDNGATIIKHLDENSVGATIDIATALDITADADSTGGGTSTIDVWVQYMIIDTN